MALLLSGHVAGEALPSSGAMAPGPANSSIGALSRESLRRLDRACTLCHEVDASFSHPTGIAPSMAVPADLPLVGGDIGCVTCHEGETGREHINSPMENRVLLRSAPGEQNLCGKCHKQYGINRIDAHAGVVSKAHLRGVKVRGYGGGARIGGDGDLERYDSQGVGNCRSCHDGSIATDVGHTRGRDFGRFGARPGDGGHPVDREYRMSNSGDADGRLRPASELDPRIVLIDNRMSCHSCHSVYSQKPGQLVMSNDRSALCLECHLY